MFAVIDFETTGLSPQRGARAIEIGVAISDGLRIVDTYQSLMDPGVWVPPDITRITGITETMIRSAPSTETVMREAAQFIGDLPRVAHNANFDRKFYEQETQNIPTAQSPFLCTMLVARRLYPFSPNHKLATLARLNNISTSGHHRALADADMTAQLLHCMIKDLADLYANQSIDAPFLWNYQNTTKANAKSVRDRTLAPSSPSLRPVWTPENPRPASSALRNRTAVARAIRPAPASEEAARKPPRELPAMDDWLGTASAKPQFSGRNLVLIGLFVFVCFAIVFGH